jgi:hypothetical protein
MIISTRSFLKLTTLLCLTAGLLLPDAGAATVSVNFAGFVKGELPNATFPGNVQAGDAITLNSAFGYNSLQTGIGGKYTFTGITQTFSLFVNTPGFTTSAWSDGYAGSPATFMITMTPSGGTTTMDIHIATFGGTAEAGSKANAFVDLVLTSNSYTGGTALPNTVTIGAFLLDSANLIWDPPGIQQNDDEGFTAIINNFNGVLVPEPPGLVLGAVAMACVGGFLICRRAKPFGLFKAVESSTA